MKYPSKKTVAAAVVLCIAASVSAAQTPAIPGRTSDGFASVNAIADTSIPFAIGAHEAQQSLRGSFGWPTFQEGLVEGVYFRFDPDGYARFSPNPRLDVDVFEVICKSRTTLCVARKDSLSVFLTERGQLQLKIDAAAPGDIFFISDGISEIQIPERILQPLDTQMENLLTTGINLIVRRGGNEIANFSLRGFVATGAYLRWIAARQDYSVLPRGWPVPNAARLNQTAAATGVSAWNSPTPQPQIVAPAAVARAPAPLPATPLQAQTIESELRELRRMITDIALAEAAAQPAIVDMSVGSAATQLPAPASVPAPMTASALTLAPTPVPTAMSQETQALTEVANQLLEELNQLRQPALAAAQPTPVAGASGVVVGVDMSKTLSAGRKLEYLMEELGLDMKTAVAVLEMSAGNDGASAPTMAAAMTPVVAPVMAPVNTAVNPSVNAPMMVPTTAPVLSDALVAVGTHLSTVPDSALLQNSSQNSLIDQILAELEAEIASAGQTAGLSVGQVPEKLGVAVPMTEPVTGPITVPTIEEYQLLSQYFRSVALPVLQELASR